MTHASLFSGIGGPEIAATMLGWDNVFHCEINEFGRKILDYWYPKSKSYEDITKTDFSEWRGKVDVLTGGFPCQPFSYAGKRRGADDDRYLWPYMFKAIDQIRPTWIVAENVAGITTMVEQGEVSEVGGQVSMFEEIDGLHRYRLAETFTLQRICDDLEGHGYSVQPVLVPACAVGAPHRRDRVFIVARRVATDSNFGYDGGDAGEDESESGEKRLQERNAADTNSRRVQRLNADRELRGKRKDEEPIESDGGNSEEEHTSYTDLQQLSTRMREGFGQIQPGDRLETLDGKAGCGRWDTFPTVSPVHRGNDGIPFDVDSLTISFSKWRTESLKAYGNAIVPQVMYEIFRAIELAEQNNQ